MINTGLNEETVIIRLCKKYLNMNEDHNYSFDRQDDTICLITKSPPLQRSSLPQTLSQKCHTRITELNINDKIISETAWFHVDAA